MDAPRLNHTLAKCTAVSGTPGVMAFGPFVEGDFIRSALLVCSGTGADTTAVGSFDVCIAPIEPTTDALFTAHGHLLHRVASLPLPINTTTGMVNPCPVAVNRPVTSAERYFGFRVTISGTETITAYGTVDVIREATNEFIQGDEGTPIGM